MKKLSMHNLVLALIPFVYFAQPVMAIAEGAEAPTSAGDNATLYDTYWRRNQQYSHFFVVTEINGKKVDNAYRRTQSMFGPTLGGAKPLTGLVRSIDAKPQTLTLSIYDATPMGDKQIFTPGAMVIFGPDHSEKATVDFTPVSDATYRVNGVYSPHYAAIWVEDMFGNRKTEVAEWVSNDSAAAATAKEDLLGRKQPLTPNSSKRDLFQSVVGGDPATSVEAKLGKPDKVESDKAFALNLGAKDRFIHTYDGLGTIEYSEGKGDDVFVDRIRPVVSVEAEELTADRVVTMLNSAGETYQAAAKAVYAAIPKSEEVLDAVASSMWSQRNSKDAFMVDGAAYLTKTLANSDNGRYRRVLAELEDKAKHKKLRKYARKTGEKLPNSDQPAWEPPDGW